MNGPSASILPKLARLIPRLGSDQDGEVVATVRAIERTLKGAGMDWHDLVVGLALQPIGGVPRPGPTSAPAAHRPARPYPPRGPFAVAEWCAMNWNASKPMKDLTFVLKVAKDLKRGKLLTGDQVTRLEAVYASLGGTS